MPLLCPATVTSPVDSVEDTVLVRLGRYGFEKVEQEEEIVDAFDKCRNGLARGGE